MYSKFQTNLSDLDKHWDNPQKSIKWHCRSFNTKQSINRYWWPLTTGKQLIFILINCDKVAFIFMSHSIYVYILLETHKFGTLPIYQLKCFNSLWPSHSIWRQGSRSTLVQVMACWLTAPSHYLNQCWLIISKVLWHSYQGIIIRRSEDTNHKNMIENCI